MDDRFISMVSGRRWLNGKDNLSHLIFESDRAAPCGYVMQRGANETGLGLCSGCSSTAKYSDFVARYKAPSGDHRSYVFSYPTFLYHGGGCERISGALFRGYDIGPERALLARVLMQGSVMDRVYGPPEIGRCRCAEELAKCGDVLTDLGLTFEGEWEITQPYRNYHEHRKTLAFDRALDAHEEKSLGHHVRLRGWGRLEGKAAGLYVCFYVTDSSD